MVFWMESFWTPLPEFLRDGDAIRSRIAELDSFIAESHKDSSVETACQWAKAVEERERLKALF